MAPKQVHFISITGGTDLAGVLLGSAIQIAVQVHLIGVKNLGMDIRILDPLSGEDVKMKGEPGELMVAKPFPTQPLYFWGPKEDEAKLREKYMESYYRRYTQGPTVKYWNQGDFISRNLQTGGFEIHGRSDGVLNPSGVRFGSAEIYSVVESGKFPSVLDTIVVGQRRPGKDEDETVILFVKCKPGTKLQDQEKKDLGKAIKEAYSKDMCPSTFSRSRIFPSRPMGKRCVLNIIS